MDSPVNLFDVLSAGGQNFVHRQLLDPCHLCGDEVNEPGNAELESILCLNHEQEKRQWGVRTDSHGFEIRLARSKIADSDIYAAAPNPKVNSLGTRGSG